MPCFTWHFVQARVPVRTGNAGLELERTPAVARYFTLRKDTPVRLFPNETGVVFVRPRPDGELPIDGAPVLDLTPFGDKPPALTSVLLVVPTKELVGLVRYVQKLGTNRGVWREVFEPQNVAVSVMGIPQTEDLIARGQEEFEEHCNGCHGGAPGAWQGAVRQGQVLGVPRRYRAGRRPVGGPAQGRPEVSDPPRGFHEGTVQGRLPRRRHLSHDDARAGRHAHALVRRLDEQRRALGDLVLRALVLRLGGPADRAEAPALPRDQGVAQLPRRPRRPPATGPRPRA